MKLMTKWQSVLMALVVMVVMTASAAAQTTKVQGTVTDEAGKVIEGAKVELSHKETGRKITLKTDKKGKFFSLGVQSGAYRVVLSKDGKELWSIDNVPVRLTPEDLVTIDLDLAKEKKTAATQGKPQMTEAQKKELERIQKENAKIGNLNKMLGEGQAALDAGNIDQAIAIFKTATEMDPTRDLLWARLGNAYTAAAKKSTDTAARKQYYADGAAAYTKAVELAVAASATGAAPKAPEALGAYYNNLGEALSKSGDNPGALAAYLKAAEVDPANAAMYYFNEGATLTNTGKVDDAIKAYDKAIAADPARADSYYYRGINLLSKATMKGNEMVPAAGTAEAFNKYLELEPEGPLAEQAKQMLAAIGAKIETSFGKGRKASSKKK